MANYIRTTDNTYPHSESQIRAEYNQTSFPTPFRPPEGYEVVFQSPTPSYNSVSQYVREITPTLTNGKYYQAFEVVDLPAEQVAINQAAAQVAFINMVTANTQTRLDDFAKTRNYDGILSACTYATSPTVKFATEGQYCVAQRDATWAALYTLMAEVQANIKPMPTTWAEIESILPVLEWPV